MSGHAGGATRMSAATAAARSGMRLIAWSVRRELWENRAILVTPLAVASLALLGFLLRIPFLPGDMRASFALDPSDRAIDLAKPFGFVSLAVIAAATLVGIVYCLGALHNERRDRSILFWKSLPVSDRITVLAKFLVPLVVLPLVTATTVIALQLALLLLSSIVLVLDGIGPVPLWKGVPLFHLDVVLLYGVATLSAWYAPVYAWLLLVSGWARRVVFLWAILPPLALCLVEKIALRSNNVAHALGARLGGSVFAAYSPARPGQGFAGQCPRLDIAGFLGTEALWTGLATSVVLLAASVWLRRRRGPI